MKRKMYAFTKQSENFDTLNELIDSVPAIQKLNDNLRFPMKETGQLKHEDRIKYALICFIADRIPSIKDTEWPNTYGINIGPMSVAFRMPTGVSFSWKYDYDSIKKGKVIYNFEVKIMSPSNKLLLAETNKTLQKLTSLGWIRQDQPSYNHKKSVANTGETISTATAHFEPAPPVIEEIEVEEPTIRDFNEDTKCDRDIALKDRITADSK